LSSCYVVHGQWHSTVLSGYIPYQPRDAALLSCIVVSCLHVLQVIMMSHVCTSCRCLANHFFILVAHDPLSAVGHVVAPEPTLVGRRVQNRGTQGGTGALPSREVGSKPWDTWRHQSPP
jgi:hypothetical protein